ncbi:hypothetical protein ATANTOWER_031087 [Ataeniobius toweri]|uniref:Uncharacterized protein n=1 Tax=Ataeniobius toweri TaxID=208326 RepID=A0ABU7AHY5_9TELE|nr:hypothetical protein [Ataeniobius toweri]
MSSAGRRTQVDSSSDKDGRKIQTTMLFIQPSVLMIFRGPHAICRYRETHYDSALICMCIFMNLFWLPGNHMLMHVPVPTCVPEVKVSSALTPELSLKPVIG